MTSEFINWAVTKIVAEFNGMEPTHRRDAVWSVQLSEGLVSTIELSLPEWMEEYAQINGRDGIKISFVKGAAIIIHQALRAHFAQESLAKS
jgi:hypothetical protein